MFIKRLTIFKDNEVLRDIKFKLGLNLIVDNDPINDDLTLTGNNVGKTTFLKLIYFCLSGQSLRSFFVDEDNKNKQDDTLKEYLEE